MEYPVRCKIIDVTGIEVFPGIEGKTPDVSKPFIGELGVAHLLPNGRVKIALDNGGILFGDQCWWTDQITPPSPRRYPEQ